MNLRTLMLALMLIACCPATWAGDLVAAAQVAPTTAQLRSESRLEPMPLDRQVAALQQQVAALQAQVNALVSAVKVTETGVVVQGPAVTIKGGKIDLQADGGLIVKAADLTADMVRTTSVRSGTSVAILSGGGATLQSTGTTDVKGSVVRFNNGGRPIATVGSQVQTPAGNGQIITGSTTVLAD